MSTANLLAMSNEGASMRRTRETNETPTGGARQQRTAPDWAPSFLAAVSAGKSIKYACKVTRPRVSRATIYRRRNTDPAFAEAVRDALEDACDDLESEARRRAMRKHKPSDMLLLALLRAHRPEKYGSKVDHTHRGNVTITVEDLSDDDLARIAAGADRPD
jgi:hypothetical protein